MCCIVKCFEHAVPRFKNKTYVIFPVLFLQEKHVLCLSFLYATRHLEETGLEERTGVWPLRTWTFIRVTSIAMIVVSDFSFKRNL